MKILRFRSPRDANILGGIRIAVIAAILCVGEVSAQSAERGVGTLATTVLGVLPEVPLYWYIDTFPDRTAAEAAIGPRSAVAESFGKVWLFTIAEANWRP